ncbi:Transcription factor GAMYB [Platanthera guangdongensis]|uniref:Transcription factor GAMYB n=1 Tax=Platanthera guangdongensis TaxID=2320717 RepID=A0ABR2M8Y8_9ASPA
MHRAGAHISREIHAAVGIRKGPWQAEEDAALMDYVAKHGPRDWSSIRSKGLLPRTGKSCRLRWVNKLKPGLKTYALLLFNLVIMASFGTASGCKFSPEEERIVIDLQEIFGNRWAQIATHLPGRTDNDVKNFWSTRRKRLARLLQSPLPIRSHRNLAGEAVVAASFSKFEDTISAALPCNSLCLDLIPFTEQCSNSQCSQEPYAVEDSDAAKTVSVVIEPAINVSQPTQPPPFDQHLLNLPPLPEAQDLVLAFEDLPLPELIACPDQCEAMRLPEAPATFFDVDVAGHEFKIEHPEMPESFFDEFPSDLFDYLEQPVAVQKGS